MDMQIDDALKVLQKKCREIDYGRFKVELKIHQGKCVGFTQLEPPVIEYRDVWKKNGGGE